MSDHFWFFIVSQIITAAGIYAAIRSDLATLKTKVDRAEKDIEKLQDALQP